MFSNIISGFALHAPCTTEYLIFKLQVYKMHVHFLNVKITIMILILVSIYGHTKLIIDNNDNLK